MHWSIIITTHYVPVRMINTQYEPVVVFKGTKVGVVKKAAPPTPVAAVEPGISKNDTISEQKQEILRMMAENCAVPEKLTPEQRERFYLLLLANADVFSDDNHPGCTNLVKHRINTGSNPPVR